MPAEKSTQLKRLVVFGDSLSDAGNLEETRLGGVFPVPATGLEESGDGRFADRLSWPAYLTIQRMRDAFKKIHPNHVGRDSQGNRRYLQFLAFLAKQLVVDGVDVDVLDQEIVRDYAVGGASSATYSALTTVLGDLKHAVSHPFQYLGLLVHHPQKAAEKAVETVSATGAQAVVSNLEKQFEQFEAENRDNTDDQKAQTLIVEWTGANDLITVNPEPTKEIADLSVQARMAHLKKLYDLGYRNFALFNLPDLSKTPLYQTKKTEKERQKAQKVIEYYNNQLFINFEEFKVNHSHPDLKFKSILFDVYREFNKIYDNPEQNGFNPKKLTKTQSDDKQYQPTPGIAPHHDGYMFWNDVHPTSAVQEMLAEKFKTQLEWSGFSFVESDTKLLTQIKDQCKKLPKHCITAIEAMMIRMNDLDRELSARNFTTRVARKEDKIAGLNEIINRICQHYLKVSGEDHKNPFDIEAVIQQVEKNHPDLTSGTLSAGLSYRGPWFFNRNTSRTQKVLDEVRGIFKDEISPTLEKMFSSPKSSNV